MTGRLLHTTSEVIDALGGNKAVKVITKAKSRQTVSNWRRFKAFPANTYDAMSKALAACRPPKSAPPSLWGQVGGRRVRARKRVMRVKDEVHEGVCSSA